MPKIALSHIRFFSSDRVFFPPILFLILGGILCLSSCAGFFIPAPNSPAAELPGPEIPESVITVPVSVSMEALFEDLGLPALGSSTAITRNVRRLLKRQALRNDSRILKNRFVKRHLEHAWNSVQKPIVIRDRFFLQLNPARVTLSVLESEGETMEFLLAVSARPQLVAEVPSAAARPLPEVALVPAPETNGFHVLLDTELPFDMIGAELSEKFAGTPYAGHGESVVIKKLRLYGSGRAVVFAATVQGTVNGTVYLSGQPAYDPEERLLFLEDLDYTIETRQFLKKTADWLSHSGIRESLSKKARWYVGDRLDRGKERLSAALNGALNEQVSLRGEIYQVKPVYAGVTRSGIQAVFEAEGRMEMILQ